MKVHLPLHFNGRQILEAFKAALANEPQSSDGHNRRWVVDENEDEIHYSFASAKKVASTTCVGVDAQLEEAYMDGWNKLWPIEARQIRLLPINPQMTHKEITIQIGGIPFALEGAYIKEALINNVLHALMERFHKKLFDILGAAI